MRDLLHNTTDTNLVKARSPQRNKSVAPTDRSDRQACLSYPISTLAGTLFLLLLILTFETHY